MTPLPTLDPVLMAADTFEWPQPPFARRQMMAPLPDGPQPCRIETHGGASVDGELMIFDPESAQALVLASLAQRLGSDVWANNVPLQHKGLETLTA